MRPRSEPRDPIAGAAGISRVAAVACALASACASPPAHGPDAGVDADAILPVAPCTAHAEVWGPAGLRALLPSPWRVHAISPRSLVPVSEDLVAGGDFTVRSSDLGVPVDCDRDCLDEVRFTTRGEVPSVRLGDFASDELSVRARRVEIDRGASFRVSVSLHTDSPFVSAIVPVVTFEPACSAPCGASEDRCARDGRCYERGQPTCYDCELESASRCACENAEGPTVDGASCSFATSPDRVFVGECMAGECTAR